MTQSNRLNRLRYRLYAPVYDLVAWPLERGRRRAIDRLDLTDDDRILVLGCGPGVDLEYLPAGADITAVDITPAMVERTERRAAEFGLDVEARVGDATDLPFDDDAFDAVLLHLVLSVVPDPEVVVAETARVLAPDGRVSILDKFVPEGTEPSLPRRLVNPAARLLFSDLNRSLTPMLGGTDLELASRTSALWEMFTVAVARPAGERA
jgi:phosphatidylethanolamine/phosphatidyl-N-methylethanolamine N-methyltransferase